MSWRGRYTIEKEYDSSVRVPDYVLKCVGFVCEVEHRDSGGVPSGDPHATGFFVSVLCKHPALRAGGACAVYFVTAKHVVDDLSDRNIFLSVNSKFGGKTTIEGIIGDRWWHHPTDATADVAVAQVWPHPSAAVISVSIVQLATPEILSLMDVGIGDEVYSTGLFAPADGTKSNIPIVRHGNIAMMPGEQIQTELGYADVYLVETRSLPGISGSPVFVRPTVEFTAKGKKGTPAAVFAPGQGAMLLGLMHGHWDVKESEMHKAFFEHDRKRGVNMGIGIVVPAIKILETINQEGLVAIRREGEKQATRKMIPGTDSARSRGDEHTITKEDFESVLKKVSRKITPEPKR